MVAAFAAFVPSPEVVLKAIGVGMAAAIAIDATVVRMLLVPAIMHLLGRANWWLPDRSTGGFPSCGPRDVPKPSSESAVRAARLRKP
jgi:hypothetical protein